MGGNSTIIAMAKWPEEFTHIRALDLLNVVSGKTFIERGAENLHLDPEDAANRLDERLRELAARYFPLWIFLPAPLLRVAAEKHRGHTPCGLPYLHRVRT